jgi:hypothetical protein
LTMSQMIGIDLGRTACRFAKIKPGGGPELLLYRDNVGVIPATVVRGADGEFMVGKAAAQMAAKHPDQVVPDLGRAPEALACLLRRLKSDAEYRLGETVGGASVAVRGTGADGADEIFVAASEQAELPAAAVHPAFAAVLGAAFTSSPQPRRIVVYDLGAASFSAALLLLEGAYLTLIRETELAGVGGAVFDQQVVDYVVAAARRQHGVDPEADGRFMNELRKLAVDAKISLTSSANSDIVLSGVLGKGSIDVDLTIEREEFERLIGDLVRQTITATLDMIGAFGVGPGAVDAVVTAGASTVIPLVHRLLQETFGAGKLIDGDPSSRIALGAAVHAAAPVFELRFRAEAGPESAAGPVRTPSAVAETAEPNHSEEIGQPAPAQATPTTGGSEAAVRLPEWDAVLATGGRQRYFFGGAARLRIREGVWHLASPASADDPVLDRTRVYLTDPKPGAIEIVLTMAGHKTTFALSIQVPVEARAGDAVEIGFTVDLATRVPSVIAKFEGTVQCEVQSSDWIETRQATTEEIPEERTASPSVPSAPVPTARYPRIEPLFSGASYAAFRSRRAGADGDAALLFAFPANDPRGRSAFLNSLLPLQVEHPNVLRILDFGREDEENFILTEWLGGSSLRDLMGTGQTRQPVAPDALVPLAIQVCRGLDALHQRHIFHRNIKPANIWLTEDGARAVIADFQVASVLRAGDSTRHLSGTIPYMAKEVLEGRADRRADLYALGVLLFEMLTGRLPFWSADQKRLVDEIVGQPPLAPRTLHSNVSDRLEDVILRALDKDPERRFQTGEEFGDALADAVRNTPRAAEV